MKKNYPILLLLFLSSYVLNAQQAYYNDVNLNLTGLALRDELATKTINMHTNFLSYANVWEACRATDEDPNNANNVLLLYGWEDGSDGNITNDLSRNKNSNGGNVGDWNREHTYPKSLGNPDLGTSGPGSDAHHLRPTDVQRNNSRGSQLFADGSGNSSNVTGGWYPGDASLGGTDWRGDVARMMMYMYLRYGSQCLPSNVAVGTTNSVDSNMINLLLEWNAADPVSAIEVARNDYHENTSNSFAQGNRNPFIDEPYLATLIWGGTPAEDIWGIYTSNDTTPPSNPTNLVASNATSSSIDLSWTAATDDTGVVSYDIYIDGTFAENTASAATTYTVNGLSSNTNYCFTIYALDGAGNISTVSNQDCLTTLAGPPTGSDCLSEDFENIPSNQGSYATRTWTGNDGITDGWTATDARTDQTLNGRAICVRTGSLTSPSISGGIGSLTVTTQLTFSGSAGTLDLYVNGVLEDVIPYSGDNTSSTTTVISDINVDGNVVVELRNSTSNRIRIDDLSWTCYSTLGTDTFQKEDEIKIYPNPVKGKTLNIAVNTNTTFEVYDLLGKKILNGSVTKTNSAINIEALKSGIYIIKLNSLKGNTTKKLIRN